MKLFILFIISITQFLINQNVMTNIPCVVKYIPKYFEYLVIVWACYQFYFNMGFIDGAAHPTKS